MHDDSHLNNRLNWPGVAILFVAILGFALGVDGKLWGLILMLPLIVYLCLMMKYDQA